MKRASGFKNEGASNEKNRGPRADSIAYLEVCLSFLEVFHHSLKTYPQPLPMRATSKDASSSSSGKLGGIAQLNDARSSTSAGDEDLSARSEGLRARQEA